MAQLRELVNQLSAKKSGRPKKETVEEMSYTHYCSWLIRSRQNLDLTQPPQ
jgi:hypothetical protein